jgi:predicted SAM-dependent methyltransferase
MNGEYRLLNIACGEKISLVGNWINLDLESPLDNVLSMNVCDSLNFPDNTFDVAYAAQFVEHLDLPTLNNVLVEVLRVLKPNGILRVVTPDLEELAGSYLKYLNIVRNNHSDLEEIKYDWIRLEMFDQIVRDKSGGEMRDTLDNLEDEMSQFLSERFGIAFSGAVGQASGSNTSKRRLNRSFSQILKRLPGFLKRKIDFLLSSDSSKIGKFRVSGEVHRYMHDSYSLSKAFNNAGFISCKVQSAFVSEIPSWDKYQLDSKMGVADGPECLFMEAKKHNKSDA